MLRIAAYHNGEEGGKELVHLLKDYFKNQPIPFRITEYSELDVCQEQFHIVFLKLGKSSEGILQFSKEIRKRTQETAIILIAENMDHALEGYEIHAFGYLLLPLQKGKLFRLISEYIDEQSVQKEKHLLVKEYGRWIRIPYGHIEFVESQRNVVLIHLINKRCHRIYAKLTDIEAKLRSEAFLRCHQSFLVNIEKVKHVNHAFVMESGVEVPIRQREVRKIKDAYFDYILDKEPVVKM